MLFRKAQQMKMNQFWLIMWPINKEKEKGKKDYLNLFYNSNIV